MTSIVKTEARLTINDEAIEEARGALAGLLSGQGTLAVRMPDGTYAGLPGNIERVMMNALKSLAENGSVSIGHLPEELTSTSAADVLGVSRPTLMKWAKSGEIPSHKVGTHARFRRDDVFELREKRAQERRRAFTELLALEDED